MLTISTDTSKCSQRACPLSINCWRFRGPPGGRWQAYSSFEAGPACPHFMEMTQLEHEAADAYDAQQGATNGRGPDNQ